MSTPTVTPELKAPSTSGANMPTPGVSYRRAASSSQRSA
jgi:hypothetical protein